MKKQEFFHKYHVKGYTLTLIHVHVPSLLSGVHSPDFAHTASLVGQDWEKINVMGVQLTYIIVQDRKTVKNKDYNKYQLYGIEDYTFISISFYQGVYTLQILTYS